MNRKIFLHFSQFVHIFINTNFSRISCRFSFSLFIFLALSMLKTLFLLDYATFANLAQISLAQLTMRRFFYFLHENNHQLISVSSESPTIIFTPRTNREKIQQTRRVSFEDCQLAGRSTARCKSPRKTLTFFTIGALGSLQLIEAHFSTSTSVTLRIDPSASGGVSYYFPNINCTVASSHEVDTILLSNL